MPRFRDSNGRTITQAQAAQLLALPANAGTDLIRSTANALRAAKATNAPIAALAAVSTPPAAAVPASERLFGSKISDATDEDNALYEAIFGKDAA